VSTSLRHIEWRSLIEITGPFLADTVLARAFPQGLEKIETPNRQRVRRAYEEWCEAVEDNDPQLQALHREWIRLILEDLLEYDSRVLKPKTQFPETLRYQHPQTESPVLPDFVVMAGEKPRLLVSVFPPGTKLESPLPDLSWIASPVERMTQLCKAAQVSLGLVTNGEQWTLVSTPPDEATSNASWFTRIWQQEPVTLQAFQSLLGVRRMFGPGNETLEALLLESLQHLDEITDTLGSQVRRAVEVLVQALDRADLDRDRQLLKDVSPAQLYEAGLTVMMRLVFTLCAEERGLLLLGEPIYDLHYAISTLRARLNEEKEQLGEDVLERRHDAWSRLLAVFRAVYGGIEHETLRLPPLGGSIFDPDRYPFLEGRAGGTCWQDTPANPLPIDNRTVLLLLNALQIVEQSIGARLLSYLALDVEQVGHVYEGLLERTAARVPEATLGLIGSQKAVNPNVPLRELELQKAAGVDHLVACLLEVTGRSEAGLRKALTNPLDESFYHRILLACGGDIALANRIKPFAFLLRSDNWGDPLVYRDNAFMVTLGKGRRESGTHYTPKTLTEPIVQHTLEPLVYVGPVEGKAREEWKLKTPAQLLALKVCDMAMGSGAFLVQTCRYLADRLVEAWDAEEKMGRVISIDGVVLEQLSGTEQLPREKEERILIARRLVASRCLYGVDFNPMAVELAKLSLWLVTMMKGRPFNFLDHALKCGDSLLGVTSIQQIENFSLRPGHRQTTFATANLAKSIEEASAKRRALEDLPSNDHTQIETKNRLHAEAEAATAKVKAVADCLIALELRGLNGDAYENQRTDEAEKVQLLMKRDADAALKSPISNFQPALSTHAREQLHGHRTFHWVVEFPEVFASGGFDAFTGNPPFLGGRRISFRLGELYYAQLQALYPWAAGTTDLCVYFFRRACTQLKDGGVAGFVLSDIITQGDSRESGLVHLCENGFRLISGKSSRHWPGTAGVKIVDCHMFKGLWQARVSFDSVEVETISSHFRPEEQRPDPFPLNENQGISFSGHFLMGQGFLITPDEAEILIQQNPANADVIFNYIKGDELNNTPHQTNPLKAINFGFRDLPEIENAYPEALEIVRQRVKPERDLVRRDANRERWWRYAEARPGLSNAVRQIAHVLLQPYTAKYVMPSLYSSRCVFAHPLVVIVDTSPARFACLQCSFHTLWVWAYCATNLDLIAYTTNRVLETFPFPHFGQELSDVGRQYSAFRDEFRLSQPIALTEIYNRYHDRGEQSSDIARLRALHVEMDQAVAAAYGWSDLDLGHGFHATKQGERYTLSEPARRTVLDRLLALNHRRYEEEVKAGLHDKKKAGPKRRSQEAPPAASGTQELDLDFSAPAHEVKRKPRQPQKSADTTSPGMTSADIDPTDLLNAIFTCAARRESTDRDELAKKVATALGFQRLRDKTRKVIASGFNSAIRRGLVSYEGQSIVRLAKTYAALEIDTLVGAIAATVRPGCVYTPEEVLHNAATHLGCLRLSDTFREPLESALTAASRRGLITKRGEEVRKAE
jgi:hypothetical protein